MRYAARSARSGRDSFGNWASKACCLLRPALPAVSWRRRGSVAASLRSFPRPSRAFRPRARLGGVRRRRAPRYRCRAVAITIPAWRPATRVPRGWGACDAAACDEPRRRRTPARDGPRPARRCRPLPRAASGPPSYRSRLRRRLGGDRRAFLSPARTAAGVASTLERIRQRLAETDGIESTSYAFPSVYDIGGVDGSRRLAIHPRPAKTSVPGRLSWGLAFCDARDRAAREQDFEQPDMRDGESVVVVNETFARR